MTASTWAEGYVADIPYALGFYRETIPAHIAFAALACGRDPGGALRAECVLELGFGMGLGFLINAAANPQSHFEGVDFNPLHVAHAQGLADEAGLSNVSIYEASFQDLARNATEGQHDLDLIVLHGILTWVSAEAHKAIVEIARKRLKPGGYLYVSYNSMPGWASVLPLQRLMRQNAKRLSSRSDRQTDSGLELLANLQAEGAGYFVANPHLQQRLEKMRTLDRSYLAHEYLNANWFIFHMEDVAEMFSHAKLGFVGSATLIENMDQMSLPEKARARIGAETDPIFKETLRDIASNKQFRRDLYARGAGALAPIEHNALLNEFRFMLAVPRGRVNFKFASPVGELDGNATIYGSIADKLAEGIASFAELLSIPVFQEAGSGSLLQALTLLVHSGQIFPVLPFSSFGAKSDTTKAKQLNQVLARKMSHGRAYHFLAAPAAGSGIQAKSTDIYMLAALQTGCEQNPERLAEATIAIMRSLGISPMKDGKTVSEPTEQISFMTQEADLFFREILPAWRTLGITD